MGGAVRAAAMKRDRSLADRFHAGDRSARRRRRAYVPGARDSRAGYLATRFARETPIPFGPHAGTPVAALPESYLDEIARHGLMHAQLGALIASERDVRETHRQIGGGC